MSIGERCIMPRKKVKKSTKATASKKRVKLEDLSQAHGKEEKFRPTTLDQVWGDTGHSKYSTLEESEYEDSLGEMNKSDLQTHATQVGIIPVDNRDMLTQRLVREFRNHVNSFRAPSESKQANRTMSKEVSRILAEGR
jgi:hypothetical protein